MKKLTSPFLQAKYHKDSEVSGLHGVTQGMRGPYLVRAQMTPNHETVGNSTHKGVHQYIMEMDRRPGVIVGKFSNVRFSHLVVNPKKAKSVYYLYQNIKLTTVIVVLAPVLPGAYYPSGHSHGHSYMHQTSMHSLRSMQLRSQHMSMVSHDFLQYYVAYTLFLIKMYSVP